MPPNATEKATEDEDNQARRAQILSLAKSCVEDTAYSKITRQEENKCGNQKRSWAPRVDNISQKRAAHVHTDCDNIIKDAQKESEMAYCFQQRRTRLAWYVRDGDALLIAEGMLEKVRVELGPIANKEKGAAAMRTR
jgi:hypothetical protein